MANLSLTNSKSRISLSNKLVGGAGMKATAQTTAYHVGDDGDLEPGTAQSYTVMSTGQFSGTTNIDTPHYMATTISFTAPNTISDAGAGLVTILTNDTVRVRGSALNDGVYTVTGGGAAGAFTVAAGIVNEGAGAYVTLCKRSAPSNNCVIDNTTGLMWKRYVTNATAGAEKVGPTSNGLLNWYDTATCYTLHGAAADLQMMTTGIKIVGGAAELPRYFVGMIIDPSGFANAVNNLPGYRVTAVAVNGADLDILLWTGKNTLIAEAAAGARDIRVVCQSIHAYCAGANAVNFSGFTDWRIPNRNELITLSIMEGANGRPNATAFPNYPYYVWSSNTVPGLTTHSCYVDCTWGGFQVLNKTTSNTPGCQLVRP